MKSIFKISVLLAAAAFVTIARAQDEAKPEETSAKRAEMLKEMTSQAAAYKLTLDNKSETKLELHGEPLLRFSNPLSGVPDGVALMWKDGKRPAVVAQVFQTKEGLWIHEVQSLADTGLTMQRDGETFWQPRDGAEPFQKLDKAPPLADSPTKRLAQMRALAEEFSAVVDSKISASDKETTRHLLRLLPRPVYRYQDEENDIAEGAMFAFVQGTDPELFLVLEYRDQPAASAGWYYTLTPMTCWAVTASREKKEIWSVPDRMGKSTKASLYHVWIYKQ
jgi:hypothetical protein